jgi:hypothetical protein
MNPLEHPNWCVNKNTNGNTLDKKNFNDNITILLCKFQINKYSNFVESMIDV